MDPGRAASRDPEATRGRAVTGSPPSTRTDPAAGCRSPAITCSSVDLPEPLGPTSAVTPGPSSSRSTVRARWPSRTTRNAATTIAGASGPPPGGDDVGIEVVSIVVIAVGYSE